MGEGGGCSGKMVDRISNLSDEVVHRILSFLVIKDLTRFGCVSKRSRELYLSAPSLDFDISPFEKPLKLLSSLDRFLFIHREVNKIQRFRISWCDLLRNGEQKLYFSDDVSFRVITWILNAVRCKVEVLEIVAGFFMERRYSLPSSVFLCGSLRSLLLTRGCTILKAPSLASSSNLEYLKLDDVFIEDEGFFKWISCSCKCIKELHLEDIFGINQITIESSSLKSFSFVLDSPAYIDCILSISAEKLEDILVHLDLHNSVKNLVNIFAPNLKYLKLSGDDVWIGQSLGKSTSLEKAEFFLDSNRRCFKILSEVLCSINKVETLVLNRETTMAVFYGDFMPLLLKNVCYLSIHVGSFRDMLVPGMVSTFEGMCNLSTLEIESDPEFFEPKTDCSGFNMGYWRLQNLSFIHQLKEVTIELSIGSNGIQFAKYVLEHAQNLKKMTVFHAPQQSKAVRKITKSKIASSAKLVFLEDRERG
ncbi:hypothetical protein ACE6H2_024116 [Prunus campanulata]